MIPVGTAHTAKQLRARQVNWWRIYSLSLTGSLVAYGVVAVRVIRQINHALDGQNH